MRSKREKVSSHNRFGVFSIFNWKTSCANPTMSCNTKGSTSSRLPRRKFSSSVSAFLRHRTLFFSRVCRPSFHRNSIALSPTGEAHETQERRSRKRKGRKKIALLSSIFTWNWVIEWNVGGMCVLFRPDCVCGGARWNFILFGIWFLSSSCWWVFFLFFGKSNSIVGEALNWVAPAKLTK